jgi:uncharacterized protein (DUF2147 family)
MKNTVLSYLMIIAGLIFGSQLNGMAQNYTKDDIKGIWLNEEKDAKVEILSNGGKYSGKIVWLKDPNEENGQIKIDDQNPDENLQSRLIMGLEILKNFIYYGKDTWEDGTIYDPNNGKTYKCIITIKSPELLNIRGYIGRAWMGLGRTTEWIRTAL